MTTTTAPDLVTTRCGRCRGTGHYGGTIANGVCFDCHGTSKRTVTRQWLAAQQRRDNARQARRTAHVKTRVAEINRREALAREALDDLADAADAEGDILAEDYRRWPARFALANGCCEDSKWEHGDGEGIDWVRHLWIRYRNL